MNREDVSLQTATVSLRTLVIGERQVTAGIIRQVPAEWWDHECDPQPWVRIGCGIAGSCRATYDHHHFLWVDPAGELRRDVTERVSPRRVVGEELTSEGMGYSPDEIAREVESRRAKFLIVSELPYVYAAGAR